MTTDLSIHEWADLYFPALFGVFVMALSIADALGVTDAPLAFALLTAGALLSVLALHRAHEYKNYFTVGDGDPWPPVAGAGALTLAVVAVRLESPWVALLGAVILVGTVYTRVR